MRVPGDGSSRDYCAAAVLVVLGAAAAFQGLHYRVGSLSRMAPGFMPVALGLILVLLGAVLFASTALRSWTAPAPARGPEDRVAARPEWRGWICICLGVLIFAATAERAGLVPAVLVSVFVTGLGDRDNGVGSALALAVAMTVIAVVIFWWGLGVPLPLFAWIFD